MISRFSGAAAWKIFLPRPGFHQNLISDVFFSETGLDSLGGVVITDLGGKYMSFSQEAIFLNTMGAILIALAILIPCILGCEGFRKGLPREGEEA